MPITVGYWDVRGRAEPIRLLLHYKNVDFEDKRYDLSNRSCWFNDKFTLDLDFPNLPYYIDRNVRLTQSLTILRYLAGKYGLDGTTEQEKLRASLAEQQIFDFRLSLASLCYDENFEKLKPEFVEKVPMQLMLVAKFLGERKFLAGDSLTYIDFMAYEVIDFYEYLIPKVLADLPTLKAYKERIKNLPQLKSYFESSTYKPWPLFSPLAKFGGSGPEPIRE